MIGVGLSQRQRVSGVARDLLLLKRMTGFVLAFQVALVRALIVGGSRADGATAILTRSSNIVASAKQPALVDAARVVGGHDGIARSHHALTHEASRLISQCLQLAVESLKIPLSKEIPALDLGPDRLDQLQVIGANPPLRHPHDRVLCRS